MHAPTRSNPVTAAAVFQALSDPTRLAILDMLRDGERCVCELQDALGAAQSRLSFHLKALKDVGLVQDRREGRWSYYTFVPEALQVAHDEVQRIASPRSSRRLAVLGSCCG
jgi:ArsR family transcriptional regulator